MRKYVTYPFALFQNSKKPDNIFKVFTETASFNSLKVIFGLFIVFQQKSNKDNLRGLSSP